VYVHDSAVTETIVVAKSDRGSLLQGLTSYSSVANPFSSAGFCGVQQATPDVCVDRPLGL
jgi:hypothetical protein